MDDRNVPATGSAELALIRDLSIADNVPENRRFIAGG